MHLYCCTFCSYPNLTWFVCQWRQFSFFVVGSFFWQEFIVFTNVFTLIYCQKKKYELPPSVRGVKTGWLRLVTPLNASQYSELFFLSFFLSKLNDNRNNYSYFISLWNQVRHIFGCKWNWSLLSLTEHITHMNCINLIVKEQGPDSPVSRTKGHNYHH